MAASTSLHKSRSSSRFFHSPEEAVDDGSDIDAARWRNVFEPLTPPAVMDARAHAADATPRQEDSSAASPATTTVTIRRRSVPFGSREMVHPIAGRLRMWTSTGGQTWQAASLMFPFLTSHGTSPRICAENLGEEVQQWVSDVCCQLDVTNYRVITGMVHSFEQQHRQYRADEMPDGNHRPTAGKEGAMPVSNFTDVHVGVVPPPLPPTPPRPVALPFVRHDARWWPGSTQARRARPWYHPVPASPTRRGPFRAYPPYGRGNNAARAEQPPVTILPRPSTPSPT